MISKCCQTGLRWLWVTLIVLVLDRTTKILAQHYLSAYVGMRLTSFLNFTLAYNKGAAFSFLRSANGWQTWLFGLLAVIVSTALLVWLKRLSNQQRLVAIALCLIIGGALGNLWDRITFGYVVDFIDFHYKGLHWPIFNIADSAICIGAFMLVCDAFRKPKAS